MTAASLGGLLTLITITRAILVVVGLLVVLIWFGTRRGGSKGTFVAGGLVLLLSQVIALFVPALASVLRVDPRTIAYQWFLAAWTRIPYLAGAVLLILGVIPMLRARHKEGGR